VSNDDETGRPMLTEMAEKLRQARSMDFHGEDHTAPVGHREARAVRAPAPATERRSGDRDARSATDAIQVSTRIDSFERRLFELRVTTPRLELRPPDQTTVRALIDLARRGIHDHARNSGRAGPSCAALL